MSEWLDLSINLEGDEVFLVLLPVALGLTYYIYRQTQPPTDRVLRSGLIAVRSLVVGLLLLILAEPILGLWSKQVVSPLLLILVDTSPSMAMEEEGIQRLEQVQEVLNHGDFRKAFDRAEVVACGFAETPYRIALDTLSTVQIEGQATDLASALLKGLEKAPDRKNLESILLISDGMHNLGEDPTRVAQEIGIPVYALGVGSEENPADIQIVRAKTEETGYVGHGLRIEAGLCSWGYTDQAVEVLLYEGKEVIGRQSITLAGDNLVQPVSFEVLPTTAGPHIYRLVVPHKGGEFFHDNNEALVFTRILEERIQVLLGAGGPSPDLAFLQRSLAADSTIVVRTAVRKKGVGEFYQKGPKLQERLTGVDVVILLNQEKSSLMGSMGSAIKERVGAGTGLLFIGGPKTYKNWDPNTPVAQILPAVIEKPRTRFVPQEVFLRPSPEGRHHPVVRLQEAELEVGVDPWTQLPPLLGYFPITRKRQGAMILVEGQRGDRPAVILAGFYGQGKVIAALSATFWRLDLLSSGVGGRPQTIRNFWRNAVKWLAIQTPAGRVRVSTEQHIYRAGEEVVFAGQVFDELLRPQSAATVQVMVDGEDLEFQLQDQGGGHYQGTWTGLAPGDYHYTTVAYAGDTLIGKDEGRFIVEQHSIESVDVRANKVVLGEMARVSGGRYRDLDEWREILELLALQKRLVEQASVFSLWSQQWLVGVVVLLLGLEWFVRKRCGMI